MSDTTPRPSSDLESSPLLSHRNGEEEEAPQNKSFLAALTDPTREMTAGEKLLASVALIFLLLSATFIGLFAGAKHRISTGLESTTTITDYTTKTATTTATATQTQVFTSIVPQPAPTDVPSKGPCLTSECVMLASSLLGYLDTKFDPCEDFVGFATSGWVKANPLPKSKAIWGSFNQVRVNNQKVILEILKKPIEIKSAEELKKETPQEIAERDNLIKMKTVFNDCLDEDHLDSIGTAPLLDIVEAIQVTFPAVFPKSTASLHVKIEKLTWFSFGELEKKARAAVDRILNGEAVESSFVEEAEEDVEEIDFKQKEPSRKTKLTNALAYLHAKDISALFEFNVEGDVGVDPQFQVLSLYQSATGLPAKQYYDEPSIVEIYEEVVGTLLSEVLPKSLLSDASLLVEPSSPLWPPFPSWPSPGPKTPEGDEFPAPESSRSNLVKKLAHQVVVFETALARAGADPEDISDPAKAYNPTPFEDVDVGIDLARYVSSFAPRNFPSKIIVTSPSFVKRLNKLVASTEDHVLQSYFLVRAAFKYANLLGPKVEVRLAGEKLTSLLRGTKLGSEVDREEVCAGHLDSVVGHLVGAEFIKTQFPGDSKVKGERIINGIIDAFKLRLKTIDWMDEVSRKKAISKAEAITPKIGYPLYPDHKSPIALRNYYARSPVKSGDFFGDVVAATESDLAKSWQSSLGNKRNVDIWEMNAQTVNAYFSPPDNEIVFPAGILQPPFFSSSWPSYLSYGSFGAVAAHELAHAFDSTGSKYDDEGRFRQWWSNSTVKAFEERANCIAEQYSKFYVVGPNGEQVHVNGNLTNGENIGDFGLRFAWSAWKASLDGLQEDEQLLPGLPYTTEQMFFLSFGRIWASTASPAQAVAGVRTDPHSPNQFRIEGTLRNFPQFAKTFNCPKGSRMNPKDSDRCELW